MNNFLKRRTTEPSTKKLTNQLNNKNNHNFSRSTNITSFKVTPFEKEIPKIGAFD